MYNLDIVQFSGKGDKNKFVELFTKGDKNNRDSRYLFIF